MIGSDLRLVPRQQILTLNNQHARETSMLDAARLAMLLDRACVAWAIGRLDAMLIAFDQDADYDSVNFQWFRQSRERFVYVDRIIVAPQARGRGFARQLYQGLFDWAVQRGHHRIVCEVNAVPANPASDAFHAALGFVELARVVIGPGDKAVRYLEHRLNQARC